MKRTPKKRQYPFKRQLSRKFRRIIFMLVAAAIASGVNYFHKNTNSKDSIAIERSSHSRAFSQSEQQQTINKLRSAKDNTHAQFWVGMNATVIKLLKDDLSGSRHQKFLIKLAPDITLLVAHNIDLASRTPIKQGDTISLYGRYEWNNRGGVIHWTHHDPKGKKKGGWIHANGKTYR